MGREVVCVARHQGNTASVKALLETDAVILRGDLKATIPYKDLTVVRADQGVLYLDETTVELGADAEKWAHKILNPPSLLDKLGLKPGMKLAVLGFGDRSFLGGLEHDTCLKEGEEYGAIVVHTPSPPELSELEKIKHRIGKKTMLWIVYPKGRKDITEGQVFALGKGLGLVDVKTCRFDEKLTGLKFVCPKA